MNKLLTPIKTIIEIDPNADPYVPIRIDPGHLRAADLSKLPRNLVLQTTVDRATIHIRHIGEALDVEIITAWAFNGTDHSKYLRALWSVFKQVAHAISDANLQKLYVSDPDEEGNLAVSYRIPLNTPGDEVLVIAERVFNQIRGEMQRTLDVLANSATPSAPIIDVIE